VDVRALIHCAEREARALKDVVEAKAAEYGLAACINEDALTN
jgi:hypothetical protein